MNHSPPKTIEELRKETAKAKQTTAKATKAKQTMAKATKAKQTMAKEAKAQAKQTTLSAQAGCSTTSWHQQEPCESCTSETGTRQVSATTSSLEGATTTIAQGNTNAQDVAQPTGRPQVAFAHLVELCSFRQVTITMLILCSQRQKLDHPCGIWSHELMHFSFNEMCTHSVISPSAFSQKETG